MNGRNNSTPPTRQRIRIRPDGPYQVQGGIPLVVKRQVVSEKGEPLTWKKERTIETPPEYLLCRCGHSKNLPFCDSTHYDIEFDGTETARTESEGADVLVFPRATGITVKKDASLCMSSGFCAFADASTMRLVGESKDPKIRALLAAIVERCPSGALRYTLDGEDVPIEPDLPVQIAMTIEITADGPIAGPLWVTGGVEIERADGKPFEPRNRVTLCNCGESRNKPLCDGTHREIAEREARRKKKLGGVG